jgi:hypothetical protein
MAWDSISVDSIAQPIDQIFQNTALCPQALFTFWMNPNTNVQSGGGEMTLCYIDSTRYTVSFLYGENFGGRGIGNIVDFFICKVVFFRAQ